MSTTDRSAVNARGAMIERQTNSQNLPSKPRDHAHWRADIADSADQARQRMIERNSKGEA